MQVHSLKKIFSHYRFYAFISRNLAMAEFSVKILALFMW